METVGDRFKFFRTQILKLKQSDIAKDLAIHRTYISKYESNGGDIPHDLFAKLVYKYDLNLNWLFTGVQNPKISDTHKTEKHTMVNGNPKTDSDDLTQLIATVQRLTKLVDSLIEEKNQMKERLAKLEAKND